MSSLRPVGRSAATLDKDRVSLCRFTFADGRQCRTPRSGKHPHFCFDHARKESQARSAGKLARELSYFFSVSSVPPFVFSVLILSSFSLFLSFCFSPV